MDRFYFGQFFTERDGPFSLDMERQYKLVHLEKGIVTDKIDDVSFQSKFLVNFAENTLFRSLSPLQEPCHKSEYFWWPLLIANEHHIPISLHNGTDHRYGIVPEHITA